MELQGEYGTAIVHTDLVESSAISQIIQLLNQEMAKNVHIRIMPSVHSGAGCVIGYTANEVASIVIGLLWLISLLVVSGIIFIETMMKE
jgi:hypothetical protein